LIKKLSRLKEVQKQLLSKMTIDINKSHATDEAYQSYLR